MNEPTQHPIHNALYTLPGKRRRLDWPLLGLALFLALLGLVGADEFAVQQLEQQTFHQRP